MKTAASYIMITAALLASAANAGIVEWAHVGDDMANPANYVGGTLPTSSDIVFVPGAVASPVMPYLTADMTIRGIVFGGTNGATSVECDGYSISGAVGKTLTLTGSGDKNYAVNAHGSGTLTIDVPIVVAGNSPYLGGYGVHVVFAKPIATSSASQTVAFETSGADSSHCGSVNLATANPDFKPAKLYVSGSTELRLSHPDAICEVAEMYSGHWGGVRQTYIVNMCDGPLVLDKLTLIGPASYGHNGLHFAGSPFVMTNCELAVSMRDSKGRYAEAEVSMLRAYAGDYSGASFCKSGTNVWINLKRTREGGGITNHLIVLEGLYYCMEGYPDDRRININGDSGRMPVLGIGHDSEFKVGFGDGRIWFGPGAGKSGKNGGFASMAGDVRLKLLDDDGTMLVMTNSSTFVDSNNYPKAPDCWVFGHAASTGTVVFENDCVIPGSYGGTIYSYRGKKPVPAVRFTGTITCTNKNGYALYVKGNGGTAFEQPLNATCVKVDESGAGAIFNADIGTTECQAATAGAWVGGKGTIRNFSFKADGCAFRGGEYGKGALTFDNSDMKFGFAIRSACGLIVDIAKDGSVGCLKLTGSKQFSAAGNNFIRISAHPELSCNGRGKILDWSEATNVDDSIGDLSNYTVTLDEGTELYGYKVTVGADGKSLWLSYRKSTTGMTLYVR